MIIDLPRTFRFIESRHQDYAEVVDGVLHIYGNVSFRKVIYNVTYYLKGNKECYYCGKEIKKGKITLDHMYAQDIGGPTIPNNLIPCCEECNCDKSNLSYEQYIILRKLGKKERALYRKTVQIQQELFRQSGKSELPEDWISLVSTKTFIARVEMNSKYKGKKYSKIKAYYKKYQTIPKPIVVDKNGFVLDGYIALMFAKQEEIKNIPVITLDNVIVHL